jgi:drug/metabolite transporter (DMT)-like permease
LWPLGGSIPPAFRLIEPAIVAGLFVAGQLFTFLALDKGDVSLATPVLGVKVVMVAVFTAVVLREAQDWRLWTAAVCSCLGIVFLNRRSEQTRQGHVGRTIMFSMQAAMAYALFDVLVMKWSGDWGIGRFLPIMALFAGLLSCGFILLFRQPLKAISKSARLPLLAGAGFIAMQGFILILTLARFGDATAVNVVYSSRGVWSVLAVWALGRRFGSRERDLDPAVFRWRLAGAAFLSLAIALLFV